MLQTMRQNTKIILWITVIFFVLLIFLVWGADLQGPGGGGAGTPGAIGTVNGDPIPIATYQSVLARNRRAASAQGRDLQPSDVLLLEEDTWNSIIDEMLLLQEAKRRGLTAHDSEIRTMLLNNPPSIVQGDPTFLNEQGLFDINRYRQILLDPSTPESYLLGLEGYVRANLPLQKMAGIIQSGAKVTETEVREAFEEQNLKAKLSYVLVEASLGEIETEVSDKELTAFFESNREDFTLPRRAEIDYVTIPRRPTGADSAQLVQDLKDFKREAEEAETSSGEDLLAYSDFETLVITFSDGPTAEEGGLSAGYLSPSEMTAAMGNAVASLEVGAISEPFLDGAFYHLVQLVDAKEEDGERRAQIRDLALRIAPSDSTLQAVREQLDTLRDEAIGDDLAQAAVAHDLEMRRASNVTESGLVPGLSAIPRVAAFALGEEPGTVSRVFETNSAWFVLEVAGRQEAGVPPMEEVRNRLLQEILQERRLEAAKSAIERVERAIAAGSTLEDAAASEGLTVTASPEFTRRLGIPGLGQEPEVLAAAFALPPGQHSGPIRTNRGWVLFRLDERSEIDEEQFTRQAPEIRRTLLGIRQSRIFNAWMEGLREKADVEDYRI